MPVYVCACSSCGVAACPACAGWDPGVQQLPWCCLFGSSARMWKQTPLLGLGHGNIGAMDACRHQQCQQAADTQQKKLLGLFHSMQLPISCISDNALTQYPSRLRKKDTQNEWMNPFCQRSPTVKVEYI